VTLFSLLEGSFMFRKMLCAVAVIGIAVSIAAAQAPVQVPKTGTNPNMIQGRITKINGNNVSFQPFNATTNQFADPRNFTVTDKVQFFRMQGQQQVPIANGLQADQFRTIGPDGRWATFRLTNNNLAEIHLTNPPLNLPNPAPVPNPVPAPNPRPGTISGQAPPGAGGK
jgi:hypothetical protein